MSAILGDGVILANAKEQMDELGAKVKAQIEIEKQHSLTLKELVKKLDGESHHDDVDEGLNFIIIYDYSQPYSLHFVHMDQVMYRISEVLNSHIIIVILI